MEGKKGSKEVHRRYIKLMTKNFTNQCDIICHIKYIL